MKHWRLVCATWLLLASCSPGNEPNEGDAIKIDVQSALQRADRASALEALEPLRARADTPEEFIELTTLMLQSGEAAHAVWILDEALLRFPERTDLRIQLARMALLVKDPSRARQVVEPIGSNSVQHLEALLLRARAELELGDSEAAVGTYAEAIDLYPNRPESALARVQILAQEGRIEEAREAVADALSNARLPETSKGHFEIAAAEFEARAGETEAAIARLEKRVGDDPTDPLMWHALLKLQLRSEQADAAVARLEAAIESDPGSPMLLGLLADVQWIDGRTQAAERSQQHLIELSDTPSHRLALARRRHRKGDFAGAVQALTEATRAHPEEAMLQMHLAESLVDAGDLEGAGEAAAAFRAQRADDPHVEYPGQRAGSCRRSAAETTRFEARRFVHAVLARTRTRSDGRSRRRGTALRAGDGSRQAGRRSARVATPHCPHARRLAWCRFGRACARAARPARTQGLSDAHRSPAPTRRRRGGRGRREATGRDRS
ncbi:MAG: tetratricopeptide repeat protein [Deltaproteobacteria bacterium]|nr:tetratricopeptide repeat protein [Deltaproteobacteria bacterium]